MDLRIVLLVGLGLLMNMSLWAEPLFIDSSGNPIHSKTRTLCGKDDMVAIATQNESIQQMARPVGLLQGPGFLCSGTLVGKDLFLTANHCKAACSSLTVKFNYLKSRAESFGCKEIVEAGTDDFNKDFLLLRLEGMPGVEWGWYDLSDRALTAQQPLMMIHHPQGAPMKMSLKNCKFRNETDGLLYHSCDTNPGSSGSAIIAPDFQNPENSRVVGIHTLGGCNDAETSFNAGPAIHFISAFSPAIKSLVK